jgi:hypothetical protein
VSRANGSPFACERAKTAAFGVCLAAREFAEPEAGALGVIDALSVELSEVPPLRVLVEVTRQIVGTLDECDDGKFREQVSIVEGGAELERKIRVHSRGRAALQPLAGDARRGVELEPVHDRARAQADGETQHLAARE